MAIAPISRLGRAWGFALGVGVVALLAAPRVFHAFYTTFQERDFFEFRVRREPGRADPA